MRGCEIEVFRAHALDSVLLAAAVALATVRRRREGEVTGTASYRERIALPPGAVFEAVLEDVSLADAPAQELGRTTIEDPGQPAVRVRNRFRPGRGGADEDLFGAGAGLGRPPADLRLGHHEPGADDGAPSEVQIRMIKVGDTAARRARRRPAIGAHGLRLPASFTGELPCRDCDAVHYRLNLWPDQVFHLSRTWEGKEGRRGLDRPLVGRPRRAGARRCTAPRRSSGSGSSGRTGCGSSAPTASRSAEALEHRLTARPDFEPFEPHLPLRGMLTYVADEARFTECLTGRDYPLVRDGDYEALEHAYLAAGAEAGGPIMASFDGGIVQMPAEDGEGTVPEVLVDRFVGVWPGETCERAVDPASLTNTYWKILRLGDTEVAAGRGPARAEPDPARGRGALHRDRRLQPARRRLHACRGQADVRGSAATTRMACPPPLDDWETPS